MQADTVTEAIAPSPRNFWLFWLGQIISSLGSSVTAFVLPLLVFRLTGSALNLAFSTTLTLLPYLCFGLIVGAWVDRVDRRRLMILTDIGRALVIVLIPLCDALNLLTIESIYLVIVVNATLAIGFDAAGFAALPNLVHPDDLVTTNGRMQAGYSIAGIAGPLLAGLLLAVVPLTLLMVSDALSFLISAGSLACIRANFTVASAGAAPAPTIRRAVREGLEYVLSHPIIRWIVLLSVLVNFVVATVYTQFVLFAKQVLVVSDSQLGIIYAAAGASVVAASLAAGPLSKRAPFGVLGLAALTLYGVCTVGLAASRHYWVGLLWWSAIAGAAMLWNITSLSLAQAIVPNELFGRVVTFARLLSWVAIPIGALIGGALIQWTQNVALVYAWLGGLTIVVTGAFFFTPLARVR